MRAIKLITLLILCCYVFNVNAIGIEIENLDLHAASNAKLNIGDADFLTLKISDAEFIKEKLDFHYLGNGWISMKWKDIRDQNILQKYKVEKMGLLKPSSKWSNVLEFDFELDNKFQKNDILTFALSILSTKDEAETFLKENNLTDFYWGMDHRHVYVQARPHQIKSIENHTWISHIEPISEERTPLLNSALPMINVNRVHDAPENGLSLKGEGIKVGVWDYGVAGFHKDLEGQLENVENTFFIPTGSQHASLVSGAIAAKGLLRDNHVGVAPQSKVFVYNFFGKVLDKVIDARDQYGVYVTNHSYNLGSTFRCFSNYGYSTASAEVDQLVIDDPKMVHLFAAGNSNVGCVTDYKTIVPGFQYGKNVILVGNLQNNETFYPGSAKGPTNDGRLAPHIMAKGSGSYTPTTGIMLPSPTDGYTHSYGTSFSTPLVTGVVALLQEAAMKKNGYLPNNVTVKAILCNTAVDIGNPGPDYDYGFGKVDAYEAISSFEKGWYIEDSIIHNEQKEFHMNVPEGTQDLKVLINWNDPASTLPFDEIMINDLDLRVETPDGEIVLPLILNHFIPSKLAEQGRDSINNIEQVVIHLPKSGSYKFIVEGRRVVSPVQEFSLSYWTTQNKFTFNYPLKDNVLAANAVNLIKWRSSLDVDSLMLQYSLDGGDTWIHIGQQDPRLHQLSWTPPNEHRHNVFLRVLHNEEVISISEPFSISPRPNITSSANCNNNIRIVWSSIPYATKYLIDILNNNDEWVNVGESIANNYIFRNPKSGWSYYFSVRAVFGEEEGERSYGFKVTANNNGNCNFALKDVGIHSILPTQGALGTEYSLGNNEKLQFKITSYANSVVNNVVLHYQVDEDEEKIIPIGNMTANQIVEIASEEEYDFSNVGIYKVTAWLESTNDVYHENDTLIHYIEQKNPTIASFPYFMDFEETGDTLLYTSNTVGLKEMQEWDYVSKGMGRIYNFISSSFAPNGKKALTMDSRIDNNAAENSLYLNIDLSSQKDSLVYLDLKYINRGETLGDDSIYVQGAPGQEWVRVYSLLQFDNVVGAQSHVKRLNLSESLHKAGQTFSEHSVVKIKTNSTRIGNTISSYGGYTIDDIKIYNGGWDLELLEILVPQVHCVYQNTLPYRFPVSLSFKNLSPNVIPADSLDMYLYVNDSLVIHDRYGKDIPPYGTVNVELNQYLDIYKYQSVILRAEIKSSLDHIEENNVIDNYNVNFLKAIHSLPVESTFDDEDELQLVPSGLEYSWELGVPLKSYLYNVADNPGKSWVTKTTDLYPNNEVSFLYVGCFDPKSLTYNSEISFLMLYNLEYGSDALWMEYSYDGENWFVLGNSQSGHNWYNKTHQYNYWDDNMLNWRTVSMPLTGFVGVPYPNFYLRFVFNTSEYIQMEGVAIDQLRINNQINARIANKSLKASGISNGSGLVELKNDNVIYAYLDDKGMSLGNVELNIVLTVDTLPVYRDYFLVPRHYHIKTENAASSPYGLTLFLKDDEYVNYLQVDRTARRMGEIGYLVYEGLNTDTSYTNNHFDEKYTFYHPDSIVFWPYLDGYEIRLSMQEQEAEVYLTSHHHNQFAYPFVAITELDVVDSDTSQATLVTWKTLPLKKDLTFDIMYSSNGLDFEVIGSVDAHVQEEKFDFEDTSHQMTGHHYYRLRVIDGDNAYYSLIDSIYLEKINTGIVVVQSPTVHVNYLGKGNLSIEMSEPLNNLNLRLVDVSGKIIGEWKSVHIDNKYDLYSKQLDLSAAGVYFLQILNGNEVKSVKFVKSE